MIKNYITILGVCTAFLVISCSKDKEYKSISGIWKCEEIHPIDGIKLYNVDIERQMDGQETFILNNFHNIGINNFVFAEQVEDSLFIEKQNVFTESFANGKGFISEDLKRIDLIYENLDGSGKELEIQAVYIRD